MGLFQLVKSTQQVQSTFSKVFLRYYATQADNTPKSVPLPKLADNFSEGTSISYIEALEEKYRKDPGSVDTSWGSFFKSLDLGVSPESVAEAYHNYQHGLSPNMSPLSAAQVSNQTIQDSMKLYNLGRAFQVFGHFSSKLDPLGLEKRPENPELELSFYNFTEQDLDRQFYIGTWKTSTGFLAEDKPVRTLREFHNALKHTYTENIGYEYMHMANRQMCNWIRDKIEVYQPEQFTQEEKVKILDRLAWAFKFETFLSRKHTTAKRFGIEGAETVIPGMKIMIDEAADSGVESFVIGMAHRGRLNMLGNVVRKPLAQIFGEFQGRKFVDDKDSEAFGSGDVKYHLGTSYDRPTAGATGKKIHLSLMANPSHLEAVNTACLGKVKAK